jgi:hypothetical protein
VIGQHHTGSVKDILPGSFRQFRQKLHIRRPCQNTKKGRPDRFRRLVGHEDDRKGHILTCQSLWPLTIRYVPKDLRRLYVEFR